jgi:hypothetical protein
MTDFRALCAAIICASDAADHDASAAEGDFLAAIDNARAALAQPEGEGPSYQELYDLWDKEAEYFALYGEAWRFARAVLTRWGHPAAPAPKPIPLSERLPEDADCLVIPPLGASTFPLRYCWQAREIMHCGQARLIWDWKLVPHTTEQHWPFTYWLPASTRFLPTEVDPAQPT